MEKAFLISRFVMPDEKEPGIVLGEFQLVGKHFSGDLVELIFRPSFHPGPIETMFFHKQGHSSITIRDRKVAKSIQDEDKFRIVLERIAPTEK